MGKRRVIILGAAGRDYFNFLRYYKENPQEEVVAFTTAQILKSHRHFPRELAGARYKKGIPIHPESELPRLIKNLKVDEVVLAYSDLSHQEVMEKASLALAQGVSFRLLGPKDTMVKSTKPVIAVCAVRTGAGKSQTAKAIGQVLRKNLKKVAVIRHPMPYGDLVKQEVQVFVSEEDLDEKKCTVEEREEYEPWLKWGFTVYAGVDYEKILRRAEKDADVIIWDGGNNDFSFYRPEVLVVVADALRPGHELTYYPGFVNFLMADVIVVNKVNSAPRENVRIIEEHCQRYNPRARVIRASSLVSVDDPRMIKGKRVLVVGDGPSLTHGGLAHGAGGVIARKYGCKVVDARKYAVGSLRDVYREYPHLGKELPAMGYSKKQLKELKDTLNRAECDLVLDGSPANLARFLRVNKPIVNVAYSLDEKAVRVLEEILREKKLIK